MKRIATILLGLLAGAAILLLVSLIGINLYLQSDGVQERIRRATAQAIGAPVQVGRTLYTPWSGLNLSGLSVADPALSGQNVAEASKFSVRFEFLPLFQRRLVISEINLQSPELMVRQNPEGQWLTTWQPTRPARQGGGGGGGSGGGRTNEVEPVERPTQPAADDPQPYIVELKKFSIREGVATFTNQRGRVIARVEGLKIEGTLDADRKASGEIWIDRVALSGALHPRDFHARFVQSEDTFKLSDAVCALADGTIRAALDVKTPRRGPAHLEFRGDLAEVSLPTLIKEAHGEGEGSRGTLAGHVEFRGDPGAASTITGFGQFGLTEAQLEPLEFIRQIGTLLRIDELQMLDLQRANLRFDIRDERVWVDDLVLQTDNVIISATGPVNFRGRLDLDGRLLVNTKIQNQLRGLFSENFTASEDAEYKQLKFAVTGRVDRPRTDLAEKLVGDSIGGFLKGMFKRPQTQEEKKQQPDKPESSALPRMRNTGEASLSGSSVTRG